MDKLYEVKHRINAAAGKSGRCGADVKLVAVTKYAKLGDDIHAELLAAGCADFGESRPQLLEEKAFFYAGQPIRWHFIGSLQRNKIRKILPVITLIHSVDSVKLAEAVNRIAEEEHIETVHCLLEVFVSGEDTKHGFAPDELPAALDILGALPHLTADGLMAMAGLNVNENEIRRQFETVRKLRDTLREHGMPENVNLTELSMGMSSDFEIAVEEGATLVRIGSLLY
ncbi:MAG: YggS family pyridoxal phosphate-dependent enzyme [Planctomycetaceae bacterium]|jgi:pyridoxal phosphate enzyme (YggS family)|nr:YggS family pyridoxal phosphate-dependent enzyme [Planctomycetaceae bacterium]